MVEVGYLVGPSGKQTEDTTINIPEEGSLAISEIPSSSKPGDDISGALCMDIYILITIGYIYVVNV